jgi:hypothetical protein
MNGLRWVGVRVTRCCPAFDVEKECFRHLRVSYFSWQKKNRQKPSEFSNFNFMIPRTFTSSANHDFSSDFERDLLLFSTWLKLLFVLQKLYDGY